MKKLRFKKVKFIKTVRKTGRIFYGLIFAVLILIAAALVISTFNVPGNYKILIVQSGSMEPKLHPGSIVITRQMENYQKNDVITFSEPTNPKVLVSHRIVKIEKKYGNTSYVTKGDANENVDSEKRLKQNVKGKVLFSVPYLGYIMNFIKTKNGLLLLVIIPSILIIFNEANSIKKEVFLLLEKKKYV